MKKIVLLFVAVCLMLSLSAQTNFQNLVLDKALDKAKGEGKMVFVDCYTSWCGPCKMMAEEILPLKEVGEYMNEKFVCVKYDMEKGEGPEIAKKYGVSSYPTFLLLNTDGSLKDRVVGASFAGEEFVYKMKLAIGDISTVRMDSLYAAGNRMSRFILSYLKALQATQQYDKARVISTELIKSLNDKQKAYATYWFLYEDINISPLGSENVDYLLEHAANFREGVGKEIVNVKLASLFEVQLEDMLRGRNKRVTLYDVETIEKRLRACQMTDRKDLVDYIVLVKAMLTKNADEAFAVCTRLFPEMAEDKLSYLYFNPILTLKGKWSEEQKAELIKMSMVLSKKVKNPVLSDGFVNFANSIIPNL
ncbi:thioredoxin family protein [Butyricimonas sp. Marseille-P3923]|uniref:thioredoxin family protein n=1 Tax=Butyricimonas sp. Marseille-P3923 TaxID=1987504 RepID=UPI0020FFF835|nr:thioredoxin family protein [Butyricimonas sp. Marseille-P3923]